MKKQINTPSINLKARYVITMISFACLIAMMVLGFGILICVWVPKTDKAWIRPAGILFLILFAFWMINAGVMVANQVNCRVLCDKVKSNRTRLILVTVLYNLVSFLVFFLIDLWSNNWSDYYWLINLLMFAEIAMWAGVLVQQIFLAKQIKKQLKYKWVP